MKKLTALLVAVVVIFSQLNILTYASEVLNTEDIANAVENGTSTSKVVEFSVTSTLESKIANYSTIDKGTFKINFKNKKITGEASYTVIKNNKNKDSSMNYTFDIKKNKEKIKVISGSKKVLSNRASKLYGNLVGFKYIKRTDSLYSLFRIAGIKNGTLEDKGQFCFITVYDVASLSENTKLNIKTVYTFNKNTMKLVGLKMITEGEHEISTTELSDINY